MTKSRDLQKFWDENYPRMVQTLLIQRAVSSSLDSVAKEAAEMTWSLFVETVDRGSEFERKAYQYLADHYRAESDRVRSMLDAAVESLNKAKARGNESHIQAAESRVTSLSSLFEQCLMTGNHLESLALDLEKGTTLPRFS